VACRPASSHREAMEACRAWTLLASGSHAGATAYLGLGRHGACKGSNTLGVSVCPSWPDARAATRGGGGGAAVKPPHFSAPQRLGTHFPYSASLGGAPVP
jgi:hypothetical protein